MPSQYEPTIRDLLLLSADRNKSDVLVTDRTYGTYYGQNSQWIELDKIRDDTVGYQAWAYYNPTTNQVRVVSRSEQFGSWGMDTKDSSNVNAIFAGSGYIDAAGVAQNFLRQVMESDRLNSQTAVYVTGQGLGGYYAASSAYALQSGTQNLVASAQNIRAVVFSELPGWWVHPDGPGIGFDSRITSIRYAGAAAIETALPREIAQSLLYTNRNLYPKGNVVELESGLGAMETLSGYLTALKYSSYVNPLGENIRRYIEPLEEGLALYLAMQKASAERMLTVLQRLSDVPGGVSTASTLLNMQSNDPQGYTQLMQRVREALKTSGIDETAPITEPAFLPAGYFANLGVDNADQLAPAGTLELPNGQVLSYESIQYEGTTVAFFSDGTVFGTHGANGAWFVLRPDGSGTLRHDDGRVDTVLGTSPQDSYVTLLRLDPSLTTPDAFLRSSAGSEQSFRVEQYAADGQLSRVVMYSATPEQPTVASTSELRYGPGNTLTARIDSAVNDVGYITHRVDTVVQGHAVRVLFDIDELGESRVIDVVSISDAAPINRDTLIAQLNAEGVTPQTLANTDSLIARAQVEDPSVGPAELAQARDIAGAIALNDATRPTALQTLNDAGAATIDALSLLKAIQIGAPLPIVASGLRLMNDLGRLDNYTNTTLSGTADVLSGIVSLIALDDALERGDYITALSAGANALGFATKAYVQLAGSGASEAINGLSTFLNGTKSAPGVLPYLNVTVSLIEGDYIGAAVHALAIASTAFAPLAVAYTVYSLIASLDDDEVPRPWGQATPHFGAAGVEFAIAGEHGGESTAASAAQSLLASLTAMVDEANRLNPGFPVGLIPQRMPTLTYRGVHEADPAGFTIQDIDPLSGEAKHWAWRYDHTGRVYNADPQDPEAHQSFGERYIRSSLERGAIAPQWEVQTARLQSAHGDPQAGLTEEERAGRNGLLAPPPAGETQRFRPIVLDLAGDGLSTLTRAQAAVNVDVDDSGYLKDTAWVGAGEGLLVLDRNLNGAIDGGRELFSNARVAHAAKGVPSLRWVDANIDGRIDAADPVFGELKLWRDADSDGVADAGEVAGLQAHGVTALNYTQNTYTTAAGELRQLASPDLEAATEGIQTHVVPEGIIVRSSSGRISLLVTQVDDRTLIEANRDGLAGYEDVEMIIASGKLLENDHLGAHSGAALTLTGIGNFRHGTGYVDGNGFVHFIPEANYFGGEAGFDYTVAAPTGQSMNATVDVTLHNVNDAPTASIDQRMSPLYGYMSVQMDESGRITLLEPQYAPYQGYDYSNYPADPYGNYGWHDQPLTHVDLNGPGTGAALGSDIDDPYGPFTYEVVTQPLKGEARVDASGNFEYINWVGPHQPGEYTYDESGDYAETADPFEIRVTDAHGASTVITVPAVHRGEYFPNLGQGGGGGKKPIAIDLDGNGFRFTDVDDSNIFVEVNGDGFRHRTAWLNADDGFLAYDLNGNGQVDGGHELSLLRFNPDGQTDLDGLRAFDSNADGVFSAADDKWPSFGIWRDADQDGVSDPSEFLSLGAMGIAEIALSSNGEFDIVDGQTIHGTGSVRMSDGTTRALADVTLRYADDVLVTLPDGSTHVATRSAVSAQSDHVVGTLDKDLILGGIGNSHLEAGDGDDVVLDDAGNDVVEAGAGNDTVYTGADNDVVIGGEGDDVAFTGLGDDLLFGADGHDALFAGAGQDIVFGATGNDLLSAGTGNDVLSGDDGDDQLHGESGNDALFGGHGDDHITGGDGHDRLDGGLGADVLDAGDGVDELYGGEDADILIGGAGDDALYGWTGDDTLRGGDGADRLVGEDGNDRIHADAGADLVFAGAGDDFVSGGAEADELYGQDGFDIMYGDEGDDALYGWTGDDILLGGDGNDRLAGEDGTDTLIGAAGSDLLFAGGGDDLLDGGADNDELYGAEGADTMNGGAGDDRLYGWTGDDLLYGGEGADVLVGEQGADQLFGGAGNDVLDPGAGDDLLSGDAGDDWLSGDIGADRYVFGRGGGYDSIYDYDPTPGVTDTLAFGPDIGVDQLWFRRTWGDLEIGVIGTSDQVLIRGWYEDPAFRVERFETASGLTLLDTQVEQLVQAMAAFDPPAPGATTLPQNYYDALAPVIAANWQ